MTGWAWEYAQWHLDLPRLAALTYQWRLLPPPAIQLARIAAFIGVKTEAKPTLSKQPDSQDMQELFSLFPSGKPPEVMSPEEYLKRREEAGHG